MGLTLSRCWTPRAGERFPARRQEDANQETISTARDTLKKELAVRILLVVDKHTDVVGDAVARKKLTPLEFQIMTTLWERGKASIREIQEAFPEDHRPAYTTVQTGVYRMEEKNVWRRGRKLGNFHIFEPVVSRDAAQGRLIDDLLALFGGRTQP